MSKRSILINKKDEFDFEKKDNTKSKVIGFLSKIYPRDTSVNVTDEIKNKSKNDQYFNQTAR